MTTARSYRSKIEVLRDFLYAAREPVPKTRLIGTANLNPLSFQKYLRICTERGLIESLSGAYVATPRAGPLLEAIDGLILKTSELELAFRTLEGDSQSPGGLNGGSGHGLSPLIGRAWNEIVLRPVGRSDGPRSAAAVVPSDRFLDGPAPQRRSGASQDPLLETTLRATRPGPRSKAPKAQRYRVRAPSPRLRRGYRPARSAVGRRQRDVPAEPNRPRTGGRP